MHAWTYLFETGEVIAYDTRSELLRPLVRVAAPETAGADGLGGHPAGTPQHVGSGRGPFIAATPERRHRWPPK